MSAGGVFGALRERRFRLLWLGQATSTLGDESEEPAEFLARLPGEPAEAFHGG